MSNRSETNKSTDRAKRVRIVEDDSANSTSAASGGDKKKKQTPSIELARNKLTSYVESLQPHMRTRLEVLCNSILNRYATYYRKNQTYTNQKNNPEFIPGSAQISVTLSVVEGVKDEPGFQAHVRKTAEVVNQCRKLLREPILECTKMNVDKLLSNVQDEFVKSLPDIAELIVDDIYYGHTIKPINKHMAVADLMDKHANDVLPIVKLHLDTFKIKYCEAHQLENFPRPLPNPSQRRLNANSQAATAQGDAEHAINMRGGTLNNNSTGNNNDPGLNTPAPAPAPTYAAVASVTQTGDNNNQTPQTSLAAAAASNQQQQTDHLRQLLDATLTTQQKAVLDTLGVEQRAVLDDVMAFSLSNTFNQGAPPVNPYTTATPGGNNNNNTTQHIQQVNNPSGDDGTGDENMEDSGNNNNGGGGNNNNIGGGNRNLIQASELFHYEQMGFIRRTLLATIKGSIVNPIDLYNEQDKLAKKASHLTNVAHKQTLTDVADKTAEALEEEAAVDPKLVKVMILDGAETAVKKLMQQKNNNNNNNNSKNKNGGGNDTTASTKNQSPHQSNRPRSPSPGRGNGGRGNQGRGRGSAGRGTGGGRGKNGKQSSKKSSRKSNDVKTRGRSKSPGTSRKK